MIRPVVRHFSFLCFSFSLKYINSRRDSDVHLRVPYQASEYKLYFIVHINLVIQVVFSEIVFSWDYHRFG